MKGKEFEFNSEDKGTDIYLYKGIVSLKEFSRKSPTTYTIQKPQTTKEKIIDTVKAQGKGQIEPEVLIDRVVEASIKILEETASASAGGGGEKNISPFLRSKMISARKTYVVGPLVDKAYPLSVDVSTNDLYSSNEVSAKLRQSEEIIIPLNRGESVLADKAEVWIVSFQPPESVAENQLINHHFSFVFFSKADADLFISNIKNYDNIARGIFDIDNLKFQSGDSLKDDNWTKFSMQLKYLEKHATSANNDPNLTEGRKKSINKILRETQEVKEIIETLSSRSEPYSEHQINLLNHHLFLLNNSLRNHVALYIANNNTIEPVTASEQGISGVLGQLSLISQNLAESRKSKDIMPATIKKQSKDDYEAYTTKMEPFLLADRFWREWSRREKSWGKGSEEGKDVIEKLQNLLNSHVSSKKPESDKAQSLLDEIKKIREEVQKERAIPFKSAEFKEKNPPGKIKLQTQLSIIRKTISAISAKRKELKEDGSLDRKLIFVEQKLQEEKKVLQQMIREIDLEIQHKQKFTAAQLDLSQHIIEDYIPASSSSTGVTTEPRSEKKPREEPVKVKKDSFFSKAKEKIKSSASESQFSNENLDEIWGEGGLDALKSVVEEYIRSTRSSANLGTADREQAFKLKDEISISQTTLADSKNRPEEETKLIAKLTTKYLAQTDKKSDLNKVLKYAQTKNSEEAQALMIKPK